MNVALFVKDMTWRPDGVGKVFKLSGRVEYGYDSPERATSFVWVSAVPHVGLFEGPETYIFPCDESGEVLDWGELAGSFKGDMDIDRALRGLGYEPVYPGYAS